MASIHVYVDTCDRQWANPPNMKGLYHVHLDVAERELYEAEVCKIAQALAAPLIEAIRRGSPGTGVLYEVYDNADGGMRKVSEGERQ